MRRISKINRIEQMQNDLRHSEEKPKQRKSNSKNFEDILKEEKNLEEKKIEKQTKQNSLDIYKVEIQKQKLFRNIVNKTVEKLEENEHDEK